MAILFIIIVIIIIGYALSGKKKPTNANPATNQALNTMEQHNNTANEEEDDSIIDVTGQTHKIDKSKYPTGALPEVNQQAKYSYNAYDPDANRLGRLYKQKLNLSSQEASWLNKFYNPTNVFLDIEGACLETIKLYLATVKELNKQLKKKETTLTKEIDLLRTEIVKIQCENNRIPYESHYDYTDMKERAEGEIFLLIFRRGENLVREAFGHKRKAWEDLPSSYQSITQEFDDRIGTNTNQILQSLLPSIAPPDEKTEEALNAQNVTRWKIQFEKLQQSFSDARRQAFVDGIYALEKTNQKNPSIENIFFEASKFIAKYDTTEALRFYIYYLYYDLKSDKVDNKQLTKTIQKSLFKTNEQLNEFGKIVADLVKTRDLQSALTEVAKIHQPKRKKIKLDITAIEEVQLQDKETVEKLNEYLHDEFENEDTTVKTNEINKEEIKLEIETKHEETKTSHFTEGISLTEVQATAIALFAERSFTISSAEIDIYCKSKGVFKNHLIESINESCYEVLDDILIEEDGDNYILNDNYYKKIYAQ